MITHNPIYNYQPLQRVDSTDGRRYNTPTGYLPSVTTILSATKSEESKQKLQEWKKRVGVSEADRITKEASNVGTIMHSILEHWVLNKEYDPGNNMIHTQAKMMADKVKENISPFISEIWGSEVNLYYPDLYAGTTDLVGMWKGKPAILDFKQTNKPKKREWIEDYFLQLSAYALAHNELYGTNITQGAIFMCSREGNFQLFEVSEGEFEFWKTEWTKRVERFYQINN
jgi:genome maintenance exonuclease 1